MFPINQSEMVIREEKVVRAEYRGAVEFMPKDGRSLTAEENVTVHKVTYLHISMVLETG